MRRRDSGKSVLRSRRGASAVEFAMVSVPLFAMLLAAIEFGRYSATSAELSGATRETARLAMISSSTSGMPENATTLTAFLKDKLVITPPSKANVSVVYTPANEVGGTVNIIVTHDFELVIPFIPENSRKFTIRREFSRPIVS